MVPDQKQFTLPMSIATQHDVSKLINELDSVEDFFIQVKTRRSGDSVGLPQTSPVMEELLQRNGLNLLKVEDREKLKYILQTVRTKAPVIHMSFSANPNHVFMEKLVAWLRENIHPMLMLQIGLQPNIGAGFTMRTTNHFFDLSLRQHLLSKSELLIKQFTDGLEL